MISDAPGGGILIQTAGGAKIEISDLGITIAAQGAEIKLSGGTVNINNNAHSPSPSKDARCPASSSPRARIAELPALGGRQLPTVTDMHVKIDGQPIVLQCSPTSSRPAREDNRSAPRAAGSRARARESQRHPVAISTGISLMPPLAPFAVMLTQQRVKAT